MKTSMYTLDGPKWLQDSGRYQVVVSFAGDVVASFYGPTTETAWLRAKAFVAVIEEGRNV